MTSPLAEAKHYDAPSVFQPAALLREARRQKHLPDLDVPPACLLDPDGDIVAHLVRTGQARRHPGWACYHTELLTFDLPGVAHAVGVIGRAVGASFAVLLAEQLFASGCKTLLSITSSGRIAEDLPAAPHFVLIERALRDEGTSHHYLPPGAFAAMPEPALIAAAAERLAAEAPEITVLRGATWTTDAPFRETAEAIHAARAAGCLAVEMEAAALYAFATAARRRVFCLAHVTNAMGQDEGDFEKGEADGAAQSLRLLSVLLGALPPPCWNPRLGRDTRNICMRTDPFTDTLLFLIGQQPDQQALGIFNWLLLALFWGLLIGSVALAIRNWQADPAQRNAAHLWTWAARTLMGAMWFQGSLWKLPFPQSPGFHYWTSQIVEHAAFGWHRVLASEVMLPLLPLLQAVAFFSEMAFAISLMLGLAVRLSSLLAIGFVLQLWLGLYRMDIEWPWLFWFMIFTHGWFIVHRAGRSLGLDALLLREQRLAPKTARWHGLAS